jgi:hypothetical protein
MGQGRYHTGRSQLSYYSTLLPFETGDGVLQQIISSILHFNRVDRWEVLYHSADKQSKIEEYILSSLMTSGEENE